MGQVVYSDFSYYYEGEGISEKLFDYRESIKDYTMIPMHSFDRSIDGVLKRIYSVLAEKFGQTDPDLISAFFMSYILMVNRHMEEPEPIQVLCIGEHLDWISRYIDADIKLMNPDSMVSYARDISAASDGLYDVVIAFDPLGTRLVVHFEKIKAMLSTNSRWIFVTQMSGTEYPDCNKYVLGNYEMITGYEKHDIKDGGECTEKTGKNDDGHMNMSMAPMRAIKTVAAITPHDIPFNNFELIKDIGAVPYLFYKNKNCKVYMVGIDKDCDYSFAKYVRGEELVKLDNYSIDAKLGWLNEHAEDVDCLMLFGTYENNMIVADAYKKLNPKGVIYLGLDASAFWINNIPRYEKRVDEFYKNCDIIGTSTEPMQKFITKKWKMDISVVRCGYYPFGIEKLKKPDFDKKHNTILTVGRIGSRQKRNDVMLNAFAMAFRDIDNWNLRLVGPIESEFYEFIDNFIEEHPYLEDCITFTGGIEDKQALHEEFENAKIFILTSEFEGFPNVIPEAFSAGNAIITTEIDNSDEIIDYGRCGLKAPINNVEALAECIKRLCTDEGILREFCEKSYENYQNKFDYNLIIDKLYDELVRV